MREFVLHGVGVRQLYKIVQATLVVECFGSLSAKEGRSFNEDKTLLLAAIDRISPAEMDALCMQNEKQSQSNDASIEMEETLSVKIRDISPFSR